MRAVLAVGVAFITSSVLSQTPTKVLDLGDAAIEVDPAAAVFGVAELGVSPLPTQTLVIENIGEVTFEFSTALTDDGGGAFSLVETPVSPLAVGTTTTLTLSFTPQGLDGAVGEVILAPADPTSPTLALAISGTGRDSGYPVSEAVSPGGTLTQLSPLIEVAYTARDNRTGSGVDSVELFYRRNGGSYASYGTFTSSPISFDTSGTGGDGTYDFYTVARDNAENTETRPWVPDVSVVFSTNSRSRQVSLLRN